MRQTQKGHKRGVEKCVKKSGRLIGRRKGVCLFIEDPFQGWHRPGIVSHRWMAWHARPDPPPFAHEAKRKEKKEGGWHADTNKRKRQTRCFGSIRITPNKKKNPVRCFKTYPDETWFSVSRGSSPLPRRIVSTYTWHQFFLRSLRRIAFTAEGREPVAASCFLFNSLWACFEITAAGSSAGPYPLP